MSAFSYISFPREVDTSCLISRIDESKYFLFGDIRGTETEKQVLDVFRERSPKDANISLETLRNMPDEISVYLGDECDFHGISIFDDNSGATFNDIFTNQFIYGFTADFQNANDNSKICRQDLYNIIQTNINPNEIAEIYTDWVDHRNIFNFGPPEKVVVIDAEQILASDLLDTEFRVKIEIRRTN